MKTNLKSRCGLLLVTFALVGCGSGESAPAEARETCETCDVAQALSREARAGKELFENAFGGTNGRACATCHLLEAHTTLPPSHVEALHASHPSDPLFNAIDADDPASTSPTYDHLKKGLVRIPFALPENMDLIDERGNVLPERTIAVWRGIPTVENTAITAPYQHDGRFGNLPEQAQAAITSHSEGPTVATSKLDQVAEFQRETFSSLRARFVAELFDHGVPVERIPAPENVMHLNVEETRGRDVFDLACSGCHGSATTNRIIDRVVHDALFFELTPEGNILYDIIDGTPTARLRPHPQSEFLNIGIGLLAGYGQLGVLPMFTADVSLPRYRFRFYTDGTRRHQVVDLPPIPKDKDGNLIMPPDLQIPFDERGAPIVGPSLALQWFSTDPGRAIVTGNPLDFEVFDVPQLRGIAHTAPYFHDNSHGTLADVVDTYSRFILPFPALNLPPIHQDSPQSPFLESLSLQQKQDLIAFLNRL